MPAPSREALRLAEVWRLVPPTQPPRGPAGEHLGGGTGSSLEFQDRRTYEAGDDLRHLDWRAFARTGQLFVKLYREEVLPRFDLLVDVSRSMGVEPGKAALTVDLAALLAVAGRAAGLDLRLVLLGREPRVVGLDAFLAGGDALQEREPLERALASAEPLLRSGSLRLLVSDFLSPLDPALVVRRVAARGGGFVLLHVLGADDVAPPEGQALRLIDSESDEELELLLDADTVARYLARLARLRESLAAECRRVAARYVGLEAWVPLEELCRERLVRAGVLAV